VCGVAGFAIPAFNRAALMARWIVDGEPELDLWAMDIRRFGPEFRSPRYTLALAWEVGFASHTEIDDFGIVYAIHLAAGRALKGLLIAPEHLLIDYIFLPEHPSPQTALIKGDARSLSIASASILAKTARDRLLCELDGQFPDYGFAEHKGYCTPGHVEALTRLGPSPVHRHSYRPLAVRNLNTKGTKGITKDTKI